MGDIKRKATFEKIFKEKVPNSEGKIWFKHPSKTYSKRRVCFMLNGKEVFVPIYMNVSSIEQWQEHFIEFVETGKFDMNFYCQVYGDNLPDHVTNEIHRFPLTELGSNKFYSHNKQAMNMLQAVRDEYGDAGLKTVPKPARTRTKLVCTNCGSDNVQIKAWVNANTNEYISECSDGDVGDYFCADCDENYRLELVSK